MSSRKDGHTDNESLIVPIRWSERSKSQSRDSPFLGKGTGKERKRAAATRIYFRHVRNGFIAFRFSPKNEKLGSSKVGSGKRGKSCLLQREREK